MGKTKFRKFGGLVSKFVEVTREKMVRGFFYETLSFAASDFIAVTNDCGDVTEIKKNMV